MKYLKRFENIISKFEIGDYVKCIDDHENPHLYRDKIYIIKSFEFDEKTNFVYLENINRSFFYANRFVLATPEEIEEYEIEQNINKYNL